MQSPTSLQSKGIRRGFKDEKIVYKLTKNTNMKFRPTQTVELAASPNLMQRIRSLSKLLPFGKKDSVSSSGKISKEQGSFISTRSTNNIQPLKFMFRLDNQTYLVGNTQQLDAINIAIVEDYIQTEHLWTLKLKAPILNLIVDDKRRGLVAVTKGELSIYTYEGRKSKTLPLLHKVLKIIDEVKILQFAKDSLLTVFHEKFVSFFIIDGLNSRQISKKDYGVDKTYSLFQVAPCIDNTLNIFFEHPNERVESLFQLWNLQIEIQGNAIVVNQLKKVYEIHKSYKSTIKIESIAKDCYFINIGETILMFKKGYLIDKVYINIQMDNSLLKYWDKKLIHIAPTQIDFYNVVIDLVSNPPRLTIKPYDSIVFVSENSRYKFLQAIKFEDHKIAFFYQLAAPSITGEIKYYFTMTQQDDYEAKVRGILPKVAEYKAEDYKDLLTKIEMCCDAVGKMGVTRKQAYLRIWRESNKESVEQFKLLLDTLDYNTIREEILNKLKKKSMQFVEVHKIEQGCLGMIGQTLFGSKKITFDDIKNYIISHFLIRKLQLFKELKIFEKSTGRIKMTESENKAKDKFLINIQQYTNVTKMDIKTYLLELIYNFIKKKEQNEFAVRIRIVIRKFKFAFRFIYFDLLKEIIQTVKQDLLFLLKAIPELLPYSHTFQIEPEDSSLYNGVWGELKEEEWEQALYLNNLTTVENKQQILEASENVWIKRNWFTYHDMIFLNKISIDEEYSKIKGDKIFYSLIEHIYTNVNQDNIVELINYLQDKYHEFPQHLYNNVFLYRDLFLYFKKNNFMHESFQQFLRKIDQQLLKQIFDHQKYKKGSFLKEIKPIYENLKQSDKFNIGLLKFFSSNLSEVSDIKYLLNRINNEKQQFHAQNEEMYQVLIKGMQIKLKLGSERDIPISQVLIYIENIPLGKDNPVSKELKILQNINEEGVKFQLMKLNMSVFEMIRNRDTVLLSIVSYEIETRKIRQLRDIESLTAASLQLMEVVDKIRSKIYGPFDDNILLFLYIVKLMETEELIPFVPNIISSVASHISTYIQFDIGSLESVVFYCYRKKLLTNRKYLDSFSYLQHIIGLLPEGNYLRTFVTYELELVTLFSAGGKDILYPISGQNGLISRVELEGLLETISKQALIEINIDRVYQLASSMEKIVVGQSCITLTELVQIVIKCLMASRCIKEVISRIEYLISLDPHNINNIIYPMLIFRSVALQFTEENKLLMCNIVACLFKEPLELVSIFKLLLNRSYSNDEQKQLLSNVLSQNIEKAKDCFDPKNPLFDDLVVEYLAENPGKASAFANLLKHQLSHIIFSQEEYAKAIDIFIFHIIIVQDPRIIIKYFFINRYLINLKDIRSFISYLSKYEIFDTIRVLEFGKRMFKSLYQHIQEGKKLEGLIDQNMSTPLSQLANIPILPANNDILNKLVKSVERFKTKLAIKIKASSLLKKKAAANTEGLDLRTLKFKRLDQYLEEYGKYTQLTYEYPFNDSDNYIEKREFIIHYPYKQGDSSTVFEYKKYTTWLFSRTNQQIEYYLLKANQSEVDAQLKRQEEALKLSFRKAPNDKGIKDNATIIANAYNKAIVDLPIFKLASSGTEGLSILPISAIPIVPASEISVTPISWTEEVEQVVNGTILLKDELMPTVTQVQDRVIFDTELINKYAATQSLETLIPQLIKQIYNDEKIDYATALMLIHQIHYLYPKMTLANNEFIEIYLKIQRLMTKLNVSIPVRAILPFDGILIKDKDSTSLFTYLKGFIFPYLNQSNIHTLSRIISLTFNKTEFQQELNTQFLKTLIKEYDENECTQFDENMKLEKITAFSNKMTVSHLRSEIQKLISLITHEQKRGKIVKIFVGIFRTKNDASTATAIEQKWLNQSILVLE